jgi:hypothetical protein
MFDFYLANPFRCMGLLNLLIAGHLLGTLVSYLVSAHLGVTSRLKNMSFRPIFDG